MPIHRERSVRVGEARHRPMFGSSFSVSTTALTRALPDGGSLRRVMAAGPARSYGRSQQPPEITVRVERPGIGRNVRRQRCHDGMPKRVGIVGCVTA